MLIKMVLKDAVCQEGLNYSKFPGVGEGEAIIHILNRQAHRTEGKYGCIGAPCGANEPYGPENSYFLQPITLKKKQKLF